MTTPFTDDDIEKKPPVLPDEFKGKTPEQMAEIIAKERTEKNAALKAAEDEKKRLDGMEATLNELKPKPAPAPDKTAKRDWFATPEEAANQLFDEKVAPLVQTFLSTQEVSQLAEVSKLPYFEKYKAEIEQTFKNAAPAFKVQPGAAKSAYDYVIGKHMTEVVAAEEQKKKDEAEHEVEFTETRSAAGARRSKSPELTEDEKRAADGQGISYEKYALWRDKPDEAAAALLAAGGRK